MSLPVVCAVAFSVMYSGFLFIWTVVHGIVEHRPYPETTRLAFFLIVVTLTTVELHHVWIGRMCGWMAWVILVGNIWGLLDAVLRFPVVPNLRSFFTLKQCLIATFKVVCFRYSFEPLIVENMMWLLALLIVNAWLPIMYVAALPFGDAVEQRLAAHDVVNVDLALRIIGPATSQQRRLDSYRTLKRGARRAAADVAWISEKLVSLSFQTQRSPLLKSTRILRCV
ncbi:unnamed protein product [Prorocentrum cordatum]|uniref:Uncharacterized protein n=1 Tax=Prorocentrum cordatum TaxID=2364126 RepID=A0ABN9QVA7_9DINO|nr:unnamed protein product [Polarella glacialis]